MFRLRNRKNPGEGAVDYQYLTKIDSLHKSWMKNIDRDKIIEISSSQQDFDMLVNRIEAYISHPDT